jgi:hypothetical protein
MLDVNGLLKSTRTDLGDFQIPYTHSHAPTREFVAAIESIKPHRRSRQDGQTIRRSGQITPCLLPGFSPHSK